MRKRNGPFDSILHIIKLSIGEGRDETREEIKEGTLSEVFYFFEEEKNKKDDESRAEIGNDHSSRWPLRTFFFHDYSQ